MNIEQEISNIERFVFLILTFLVQYSIFSTRVSSAFYAF